MYRENLPEGLEFNLGQDILDDAFATSLRLIPIPSASFLSMLYFSPTFSGILVAL